MPYPYPDYTYAPTPLGANNGTTVSRYSMPSTPPPPQQYSAPGIIWVQGEAGAKAYPVSKGNSVLLMDSETNSFYIKSTDANGVPQPLERYEYKKVEEPIAQKAPSDYVTKEDFDAFRKSIEELLK